MTISALSVKGFQELLDRFGGNLEAWPAADRDAAQALLATSEDARSRLKAAQAMDAALRETPKAPAGLVDKILSASGAQTKKS